MDMFTLLESSLRLWQFPNNMVSEYIQDLDELIAKKEHTLANSKTFLRRQSATNSCACIGKNTYCVSSPDRVETASCFLRLNMSVHLQNCKMNTEVRNYFNNDDLEALEISMTRRLYMV